MIQIDERKPLAFLHLRFVTRVCFDFGRGAFLRLVLNQTGREAEVTGSNDQK
jgi:hypothetical protein